jgi:hypothetical protein
MSTNSVDSTSTAGPITPTWAARMCRSQSRTHIALAATRRDLRVPDPTTSTCTQRSPAAVAGRTRRNLVALDRAPAWSGAVDDLAGHPAFVEDDHPREGRHPVQKLGDGRVFPIEFHVRNERAEQHKVDRSVADHLVGNVGVAPRVAGLSYVAQAVTLPDRTDVLLPDWAGRHGCWRGIRCAALSARTHPSYADATATCGPPIPSAPIIVWHHRLRNGARGPPGRERRRAIGPRCARLIILARLIAC